MVENTPDKQTKQGIKVAINQNLAKRFPFGKLESRLALAKILSFYGDSDDVYILMQLVSHTTRAYLKNEQGLKGFLICGYIQCLHQAKVDEQLIQAIQEDKTKRKIIDDETNIEEVMKEVS